MTDREKVNKGLECLANENAGCYTDCPYYESRISASCFRNMAADALDMLQGQEPIAPKLIKMYPHDIYECGNCGHRSVGSKDYKAKYCPECGRALKWK